MTSSRIDGAGNAPNTHVVAHGGRLLAVAEGFFPPVRLAPDLAQMSVWDCQGALSRGFTGHPKIDPATGDLHAVTHHAAFDNVRYLVLSPDGRVKHTAEIELQDRPLVHDMAMTETRVVVLDLPVTAAAAIRRAQGGEIVPTLPLSWDDQHPARLGVLPIGGTAQQVCWIEAPRCFVFHVLNAFDNPDGSLSMDVVRYDQVFGEDMRDPGNSPPTLARWTVNPTLGTVNEAMISHHCVEFPRIDDALTGRPHRYGWFAGIGAEGLVITDDVQRSRVTGFEMGPLVKVDTRTGEAETHHFGPGRVTMEPVFVPRAGAGGEDDGWILSVVHDANVDRAELVVLDAADLAAEPIARVHLPRRVPFGFHGNWISDDQLS